MTAIKYLFFVCLFSFVATANEPTYFDELVKHYNSAESAHISDLNSDQTWEGNCVWNSTPSQVMQNRLAFVVYPADDILPKRVKLVS